ncbi:amidohydrolase [Altererythrobacter sp. Root672]|uniref:amidohydrolase n=1 Tax=Altererythrobacter sp. Root672 TaxID=1736584 RepID=UPI0006F5398E|nr:amidohydrolase [Altererythrobacter sp. Root672]KRA84207.1 amidohydrolase [Altererythrobacter sp. Root672]
MKKIALALACTILTSTPALSQPGPVQQSAQPTPADTIITNGRIYTPSGWVTSLAISHGAIVAVGDSAAVERHRSPTTRVLDLQGKTVLPGLHDMHVHPGGAGMEQFSCQLPHGSSPQQIFDITAACAKKLKPGEWVQGRAYQADSFGDTPPHRSMLDKVAPNNPVIFSDISGHSSWANSAALRIAGITRDTPNPPGGIIERDANGEPTGVLRESAAGLVSAKVPPPSAEQQLLAHKWSTDLMLSFGITAFDDAGVSRSGAIAYSTLADRGELKQRVRGCMWFRDASLINDRMLYARDRFSPTCVKVVLDGVPTDGHTAAMVENYVPSPHLHADEGREKGMLLVPQDELNRMVTQYDAMGLTVKFHAAGDAAVHAGLDAIAAARNTNGFSGSYHNVGHNSFVQMDDIRRARSIGAAFEFSPYIWYVSPIIGDIRKAVGEERMKRWIPVKDALDAGALSVPGSDWSVVPSVNPWIAIETLVTRQVPGGGGEALGAEERITLEQAVDMFTRASARQMNMDASTGTIERGKLADLVVIDRNIFEVPITTVHDTRVLRTFINGEEVYTAPAGN